MSRIIFRDIEENNVNVCLSRFYAGLIVKLRTPRLIPYAKIVNVIWIKYWLQLEFGQRERNFYLTSKKQNLKEFEESLMREMKAFPHKE